MPAHSFAPLFAETPEDDTLCKMRVLMFGWEYPPYAAGGLATATIALANGLVRLGHDVTLFASADSITAANLVSGVSLDLILLRAIVLPYCIVFVSQIFMLGRKLVGSWYGGLMATALCVFYEEMTLGPKIFGNESGGIP